MLSSAFSFTNSFSGAISNLDSSSNSFGWAIFSFSSTSFSLFAFLASTVWSAGAATSLFSSAVFSVLSFVVSDTVGASDARSSDDWLSFDGSTDGSILSSATISSPVSPAAWADEGEKSRA